MTRSTLTLALLVALAAGCASDPSAPAPLGLNAAIADHGLAGAASGSGHLVHDFGVPLPYGLSLRNFTFTARRDASGTVSGEWQIVAGGSILHGQIDCLTIAPDGAHARLSGVIDAAKYTTFLPGTSFAMAISDNGNGASGEADATSELLAFRNTDPSVGRSFCEDGTVPAGADVDPIPVDHGNFSIRSW